MSEFDWKEKIAAMKQGTIDIHTAANELEIMLDRYDWFYSTVVEGKSICVYVQQMGKDIRVVPDIFYGYQIKIGFASYLTCGEKYGKKRSVSGLLSLLEDME